jgi:hypothetical protein
MRASREDVVDDANDATEVRQLIFRDPIILSELGRRLPVAALERVGGRDLLDQLANVRRRRSADRFADLNHPVIVGGISLHL